MGFPLPPNGYVPEFCNSSLERVSSMISILNDKFLEIKELISKNDGIQQGQTEKLSFKIDELEKLYHEIDKEIYKIKSISDLIHNQSKINVDFSGNFTSLEKRIKIIFTIIFLGISGFSALLFICIRMWLGGI